MSEGRHGAMKPSGRALEGKDMGERGSQFLLRGIEKVRAEWAIGLAPVSWRVEGLGSG
jgi:hypothetical protein